jgi:hypothetical protein
VMCLIVFPSIKKACRIGSFSSTWIILSSGITGCAHDTRKRSQVALFSIITTSTKWPYCRLSNT